MDINSRIALFLILLYSSIGLADDVIKFESKSKYLLQAERIDGTFRTLFRPNWMGAYGLIGQAYLYRLTKDESYLNFAVKEHNLLKLDNGEWVDDVAWVSLAILHWWDATGRVNKKWLENVQKRYDQARRRKLLSCDEGYWTWYNIRKSIFQSQKRFTNGNMNQMVVIACWLYEATKDQKYLDDALLVWNGDEKSPGIEKKLYKGNGRWEGRPGPAASGGEVPFNGTEHASIAASLYRVTKQEKYRKIAIDTVKYILNPANDWVDKDNYYQKYIDGNGAFINFLMDVYSIAPKELSDVLKKCKKMLDYVWTNADGKAKVILHRKDDDAIRHGWNMYGGEDGYLPDEIGGTLSQGEALRAWGVVAYYEKN